MLAETLRFREIVFGAKVTPLHARRSSGLLKNHPSGVEGRRQPQSCTAIEQQNLSLILHFIVGVVLDGSHLLRWDITMFSTPGVREDVLGLPCRRLHSSCVSGFSGGAYNFQLTPIYLMPLGFSKISFTSSSVLPAVSGNMKNFETVSWIMTND